MLLTWAIVTLDILIPNVTIKRCHDDKLTVECKVRYVFFKSLPWLIIEPCQIILISFYLNIVTLSVKISSVTMVIVHLFIIIVLSLEGNKMISVQRPKVGNLKQTRVTREFNGDEVNVTMEIIGSDIVCNQVRNFANISTCRS